VGALVGDGVASGVVEGGGVEVGEGVHAGEGVEVGDEGGVGDEVGVAAGGSVGRLVAAPAVAGPVVGLGVSLPLHAPARRKKPVNTASKPLALNNPVHRNREV